MDRCRSPSLLAGARYGLVVQVVLDGPLHSPIWLCSRRPLNRGSGKYDCFLRIDVDRVGSRVLCRAGEDGYVPSRFAHDECRSFFFGLGDV